jgi:hypothetical protein
MEEHIVEEYVVKIDSGGTVIWYQNNKIHRLGGPAVKCTNGYKAWYQKGKQHRLDGPAVECANGTKIWFLNGKEYSQDKFEEITKIKTKELTLAEVSSLLGYEVKIIK